MFTDTDSFIAKIPDLIVGVDRLHALFATYNSVPGCPTGPVETGKDRLTVQVQNGNLFYSPVAQLVCFVGAPLARIGAQAMDDEARTAQSELEAALRIEAQQNALFVAVVYAGLSAFDEAIGMANRIKEDRSEAKVVIVTCNCDLHHKKDVLSPMLDRKEIDAVVVTPQCGGYGPMRAILKAIIAAWPAKVPV